MRRQRLKTQMQKKLHYKCAFRGKAKYSGIRRVDFASSSADIIAEINYVLGSEFSFCFYNFRVDLVLVIAII